ncbi:MAG: DUF4136 domain-containing protein [Flavobacteriales bacterium]|nr:DUF4136 domain-containing protein [Flavobacteriales bacterium]
MKKYIYLLSVLMLSSCVELEPLIDYDPKTDFATYTSFSVCEPYQETYMNNKMVSQENVAIIKEVLKKKVEKLGYVYDEVSPDLLVSFDLKFEERKVNYTQCRSEEDYDLWAECTLEEYVFTQGTMVVTLLDNSFDQVVWIGSLEEMWPERNSSKFRGQMNTFVDVLFLDFPLDKKELKGM